MKWKTVETGYKNQIEIIRSQTPYERLGIEYGVTIKEARIAYKKKIKLYHPDRTDEFMLEHGQEISKLLNDAIEQIKMELN